MMANLSRHLPTRVSSAPSMCTNMGLLSTHFFSSPTDHCCWHSRNTFVWIIVFRNDKTFPLFQVVSTTLNKEAARKFLRNRIHGPLVFDNLSRRWQIYRNIVLDFLLDNLSGGYTFRDIPWNVLIYTVILCYYATKCQVAVMFVKFLEMRSYFFLLIYV